MNETTNERVLVIECQPGDALLITNALTNYVHGAFAVESSIKSSDGLEGIAKGGVRADNFRLRMTALPRQFPLPEHRKEPEASRGRRGRGERGTTAFSATRRLLRGPRLFFLPPDNRREIAEFLGRGVTESVVH